MIGIRAYVTYIVAYIIYTYILYSGKLVGTFKVWMWDIRVYDNSKECDRLENYERRFVTNDGLRMREEGIRWWIETHLETY